MTVRCRCALLMVLPLALTLSLCGQSPSAMKRYVDAGNGVSFTYPAAWIEEKGDSYGGDPLLGERDTDKSPAVLKLSVSWVTKGSLNNPSDLVEDWWGHSLSLAYALLPAKTAHACAVRFVEDDDSNTLVIHGVTFHHIQSQDAGLGHSWSFDLYTTFRHGKCLGFSMGSDSFHPDPDDWVPMTPAQKAVPADPKKVLKTLHITR